MKHPAFRISLIAALLCIAIPSCVGESDKDGGKTSKTAGAGKSATPASQPTTPPAKGADPKAADPKKDADPAKKDEVPAKAAPKPAKKYTFKDKKKAKRQFQLFCSTCHGTKGKGDGPAGMALNPKPRNWTDAKWQESVTDEHIFKVMRDGGAKHGLSPLMPMNPEYADNPAVLHALVSVVRSFKGKK